MSRRRQGTGKKKYRPLRSYEIALVIAAAILFWVSSWGPIETAVSYAKSIKAETQWGDTFHIYLYYVGIHNSVYANIIYQGEYFCDYAGKHSNIQEVYKEPECLFQKDGYNVYQLHNSLICIKDGRMYTSGRVQSVTADWLQFAVFHWDLRPETTDETVLAELADIRQECIDRGLVSEPIGEIK